MAGTWSSLGRHLGTVARGQGLVGRMQRATTRDRSRGRRRAPAIAVRPAASSPVPTRERARQVVYCPHLDGRADPGEIVWTWVPFEEDPSEGKDRPVLVVGRDDTTLLGLLLSPTPTHTPAHRWIDIGSGPWDYESRTTWVRLDHILDVPEEGIRREGAILPLKTYDLVAHLLCREYHWR
ncbi:type II toxin-antitoxin system PemK/MazF family toxin [Nocardia alni]|uniref:type II toxin-antitoxin system PemK/MazF family toxin n=1 Tax=Nocardia alni TaxID=2815723 RepID=UPI001C247E71|nr:type II toxin-antitoxin system PemK/MazF family toxin [Nocardia alni]